MSSRVGASSGPPMPQARRRPYNGRGGGECSEDRRSMQNDQTTQDAKRLLGAMSTNHAEARMVRPFSPDWADAEQAGLDRVRRDAAMWWQSRTICWSARRRLRTYGTKGRD